MPYLPDYSHQSSRNLCSGHSTRLKDPPAQKRCSLLELINSTLLLPSILCCFRLFLGSIDVWLHCKLNVCKFHVRNDTQQFEQNFAVIHLFRFWVTRPGPPLTMRSRQQKISFQLCYLFLNKYMTHTHSYSDSLQISQCSGRFITQIARSLLCDFVGVHWMERCVIQFLSQVQCHANSTWCWIHIPWPMDVVF